MFAFDSLNVAYTAVTVFGWLLFAAAGVCGLWALWLYFAHDIRMLLRRWRRARTPHHPTIEATSLVTIIRRPADWERQGWA